MLFKCDKYSFIKNILLYLISQFSPQAAENFAMDLCMKITDL